MPNIRPRWPKDDLEEESFLGQTICRNGNPVDVYRQSGDIVLVFDPVTVSLMSWRDGIDRSSLGIAFLKGKLEDGDDNIDPAWLYGLSMIESDPSISPNANGII